MPRVTSIKKVGEKVPQKCIRVENPNGLFVLDNGLITHNSSEYIMRMYNDTKSRIESRMHGNYFGRALLLTERVQTPSGSKQIGDIQVGDEIITPYGSSVVDSIPFEGLDDVYEVELEDGRKIKCNLNHLWPYYCEEKKLGTTEELINLINNDNTVYLYEKEDLCE